MCPFVCLFVCLFSRLYLKTNAPRITKLDIEMFPHESWRPSICPSACLFRRYTHRDSPGGSMRRGQRTFPPDNKDNRHTCLIRCSTVISIPVCLTVVTAQAPYRPSIAVSTRRLVSPASANQSVGKLVHRTTWTFHHSIHPSIHPSTSPRVHGSSDGPSTGP